MSHQLNSLAAFLPALLHGPASLSPGLANSVPCLQTAGPVPNISASVSSKEAEAASGWCRVMVGSLSRRKHSRVSSVGSASAWRPVAVRLLVQRKISRALLASLVFSEPQRQPAFAQCHRWSNRSLSVGHPVVLRHSSVPNPSVKGTACGKPQAAPYVER